MEIQPNTLYEQSVFVPFLKTIVKITIFLPPKFPSEYPVISIEPRVPLGRVSASGQVEIQWNQHMKLGNTIKDILQELLNYSGPNAALNLNDIHPSLRNIQMISDLELLLNDEDEFNDFFEDLDQIKSTRKLELDLIASNVETCRSTAALEPQYHEKLNRINTLIQEENQLRMRFQELAQQHQLLADKFKIDNVKALIKKQVDGLENQSDECIQELQYDATSEAWIKKYQQIRKSYHLAVARLNGLEPAA